MKIAIHKSKGFSRRWIEYCQEKKIDYKIVNCYHSGILKDLIDCDALMWHFSQDNYKDMLFARQLLFSVQHTGKKVFPDFHTNWHFDDKVGQKYLLEAIGAPLVPSYVFYDKQTAIEWIENTRFPKVFKLRSGAGSSNVKLISNVKQARKLLNKAFGKGFPSFDKWEYLHERFRKTKEGKDGLMGLVKGIGRLFIKPFDYKMIPNQKGYAYFQDFIPENTSDTRIIVVGNKAFGIKRNVRKNDFRASGSGSINYNHKDIDTRCVKIAFAVNKNLNAQCLAYDFVFDHKNTPLIVEISYGFAVKAYDHCEGYWDSELYWHEQCFNPQEWMVEKLIENEN